MESSPALIRRNAALARMANTSLREAQRREKSDPEWPRPVHIGPRTVAYNLAAVEHWINSRAGADEAAERARHLMDAANRVRSRRAAVEGMTG